MVYQVPKSRAESEENRFAFEVDGVTYSIPLLQFIKGETVQEMADLERIGGITGAAANFAMFGPADTPAGRAVRTLDVEQVSELAAAWVAASSVTPGKSSAS